MRKNSLLKNIKKEYKENKEIRHDSLDGYVVLENISK